MTINKPVIYLIENKPIWFCRPTSSVHLYPKLYLK